jgi:hypothetical protein
MSLVQWLLVLIGPWLVVGAVATMALGPARAVWTALVRPAPRPVARRRPARWAVV